MSDRMLPKMNRNLSMVNPVPLNGSSGYHSLNNGKQIKHLQTNPKAIF